MAAKTILLNFLILLMFSSVTAQVSSRSFDLYNLNKSNKLHVSNRALTSLTEGDKKFVRFSDTGEDAVAWLEGMNFEKGTIELEIRGNDTFQRSFVGVAFHGIDEKTYDAIYFRPFNFLATDSVRRIHAVQYISHPEFTWKKLRAEQNGKYEKSIGQELNPNDWFPVKIVVDEKMVTVFVNNSETPCLTVPKLNSHKNGKLGLYVAVNSGGDFANLRITPGK